MSAQPSAIQQDRIVSLDVLRGFALMGILFMNIQSFSMPFAAYLNPTAYGDLTGANWLVWLVCHVLTDLKFITIFSLLFGVGVLVFTERLEAKQMAPATLHYRRTAWMLLFGLMHAYLLWSGDILVTYALCGFIVYWLRKLSPERMLVIALILFSVPSLLNYLLGTLAADPAVVEELELRQQWQLTPEEIQADIAAYTGDWQARFQARAEVSFAFETFGFLSLLGWRTTAVMLLGMAMYKRGFFSLNHSNTFYQRLALLTLTPGFALVITGVVQNTAHEFSLSYSMFTGALFNYWGSVMVSVGYSSLIMLAMKSGWLTGLQTRLAALGKTAFSNYIMQTLICTTLFYHFGFFGQFSRVEQLLVVLFVVSLQLWLPGLWLKRFRFGPLEWIWRSLTYWQMQPLKK